MVDMQKCFDYELQEIDNTHNAFEVSLSNIAEEWACRVYDGAYEVQGILRISQSLRLKYEAPLDLVLFFDLPSALKMRSCFWYIKSPYVNDDLNHKLAKELLQEDFEAFIKKRFNYATIPIKATISDVSSLEYFPPIFTCDFDIRHMSAEDSVIPIGVLSKFSKSGLNFDLARDSDIYKIDGNDLEDWAKEPNNSPQYLIKPPLVRGVFATTKTRAWDFFVNLRDKPNKENGKIIMQLYSKWFRTNLDYEERDLFLEAQRRAQKEYFAKNKDKMIRPFYKDENSKKDYTIFVDDILEGDWARVRILRNDLYIDDNKPKDEINSKEYTRLFLNEPSKITLNLGYIHTSGLEPFRVFAREA